MQLQSPWIHQLQRSRPVATLRAPASADVAVVGAGIAGATTAYFLLTRTKKSVLLLEAGRVAHGATGHNAGQLTSYFERPFQEMVEEFGLTMAAEGQQAVYTSWELLADMRADLAMETPCHVFTGYAGCLDAEELLVQLRNNALKHRAGVVCEEVFVADSFAKSAALPREMQHLFTVVPHDRVLDMLETDDTRYIAALAGKKGCMNSARFTEELIAKLLRRYPKRLRLAENTPVTTVRLHDRSASLETPRFTATAKRVVLCTNGFENFHIVNENGGAIDAKFHHRVRGAIGYMAAFIEDPIAKPTAISYLPPHKKGKSAFEADPYMYMTRRPHGTVRGKRVDLVCVGGPEVLLQDTTQYQASHEYPKQAHRMIDTFMQRTYRHADKELRYTYFWHGLMGFTPNGMRCVGEEPCNPVLMYNLGCNGVGILPSVYGSLRIAQIVNGEVVTPSIFDPVDQRCILPLAAPSGEWLPPQLVWGAAACWALVTVIALAMYWAGEGALVLGPSSVTGI